MSKTIDSINRYEQLSNKLSLLIYLQNFLKAGEDVDGNPFENEQGFKIKAENIQELLAELELLEGECVDEFSNLCT